MREPYRKRKTYLWEVTLVTTILCLAATAFLLGPPLWGIYQARKWNAIPCLILWSTVETVRTSEQCVSNRLAISYRYEFDGRVYHSHRYNFSGAFDESERSSNEAIVRAYPEGLETVCYVNPGNPVEAVLNRDGGGGLWLGASPLLLALLFIWELGVQRRAAQPIKWESGVFIASTLRAMMLAWVIALSFLALLGWWGMLGYPRGFQSMNPLLAPLALVGFVTVGLSVRAINVTLQYLKIGKSIFKSDSLPALVDGSLEGGILLRKWLSRYAAGKAFYLRLQMMHRHTLQGGNRQPRELVQWEHSQLVEPDGRTLPVSFYIPADAQETTTLNNEDGYFWRLEVELREPGVDYLAQFTVPVFQGELSACQQERAKELQRVQEASFAAYEPPSHSRIRREVIADGGMAFVFPAFWNWSSALIWTLFIVFSAVAAAFFASQGEHLVASLFAVSTLVISLVAYRSIRVVVNRTGIEVVKRWFGVPVSRRFASGEIKSIRNLGEGGNSLHMVQILLRNGRGIGISSIIKDKREAEWLASEMARLVDLEAEVAKG